MTTREYSHNLLTCVIYYTSEENQLNMQQRTHCKDYVMTRL